MKEAATTFRTSVRSPALAMWVRGLSASISDGGGEGIRSYTIAKNGKQELVSEGQSYVFSQRFPEVQLQMSRNKTSSSFQFRPITSKRLQNVTSNVRRTRLQHVWNGSFIHAAEQHIQKCGILTPLWNLSIFTMIHPFPHPVNSGYERRKKKHTNDFMLLFGIKDGK